VPEQREFLFERPQGRQHPIRPPQPESLRLDLVYGSRRRTCRRSAAAAASRRRHLLAGLRPAREAHRLGAPSEAFMPASQMRDSSNGFSALLIDS
jgi:hypothetical protein